ncbi:Phenylalanine--tRNA ligase, mitochondrial [Choanephora cucurbitarum]|uniref:Phenylalanine--tRNA ligase, mitochondrial n=1 Tax=Choanephora cucurbitarum TaxID=101091 RepID=A0A1C7N251_9FUNG|nr:Phenylalanine--tRNA ligase, mitochondrial [Choanephora cucurbitarum]
MLRTSFRLAQTSHRVNINSACGFLSISRNCYYSTSAEFEINAKETVINGKHLPRDDWTNVSPTVLSKINRKLYLQPKNPISIIRQLIESNFKDFDTYNNFDPIVTTKQNFDDLHIPADHPSRTKSDNYYFNKETVLRAHTSAHQLQGLASGSSKFLISGDVYRRDEIDSSHYPVFHQIEGFFYVDNNLTKLDQALKHIKQDKSSNIDLVDDTLIKPENPYQDCHLPESVDLISAHLKHSINAMIRNLFADEPNLKVRWIDAYFPFTSPSWEVEIFYKGEWLEVLGCGVVNQKIMNQAGLNDKIGWAFGMGLERLAMVLFGIPDIRLFWSEDPRFIEQFTPDISFWLPEGQWSENDFCELVRGAAGDIVETVDLIDDFTHPKTKRRSLCYRINYRSMDRNVTNEEINSIQEKVRSVVQNELNVELR